MFIIAILVSGCMNDEENGILGTIPIDDSVSEETYEAQHPKRLINYEHLLDLSASNLSGLAYYSGVSYIIPNLQYDISIYRIEYKTHYEGELITVSGLVSIPNGTDNRSTFPLLCLFDGTFNSEYEAPINFHTGAGNGILLSSMASFGYITLIPDGIGFGSSKGKNHPYYRWNSIGKTGVDLIRASLELLENENNNGAIDVETTENLFLAGYSAGGYSAMATQRRIEEYHPDEFTIIGNACGAGAYDLAGMFDHIKDLARNGDSYAQPSYIAYLALAYTSYPGLDALLDKVFAPEFASSIPDLFDGNRTTDQINGELDTDLSQLFSSDFLSYAQETNIEDEVLELFEEKLTRINTFPGPHGWVPNSPIFLYHSTQDEIVPYENSENTFNTMLEGGATDIELFPLFGGHSDAMVPFIIGVFEKFGELSMTEEL